MATLAPTTKTFEGLTVGDTIKFTSTWTPNVPFARYATVLGFTSKGGLQFRYVNTDPADRVRTIQPDRVSFRVLDLVPDSRGSGLPETCTEEAPCPPAGPFCLECQDAADDGSRRPDGTSAGCFYYPPEEDEAMPMELGTIRATAVLDVRPFQLQCQQAILAAFPLVSAKWEPWQWETLERMAYADLSRDQLAACIRATDDLLVLTMSAETRDCFTRHREVMMMLHGLTLPRLAPMGGGSGEPEPTTPPSKDELARRSCILVKALADTLQDLAESHGDKADAYRLLGITLSTFPRGYFAVDRYDPVVVIIARDSRKYAQADRLLCSLASRLEYQGWTVRRHDQYQKGKQWVYGVHVLYSQNAGRVEDQALADALSRKAAETRSEPQESPSGFADLSDDLKAKIAACPSFKVPSIVEAQSAWNLVLEVARYIDRPADAIRRGQDGDPARLAIYVPCQVAGAIARLAGRE
jgi:hypothetical protein